MRGLDFSLEDDADCVLLLDLVAVLVVVEGGLFSSRTMLVPTPAFDHAERMFQWVEEIGRAHV